MRSVRLVARAITVALAALAIARTATGATVEIRVHDNQGSTLGDVYVGLMPMPQNADPAPARSWASSSGRRGRHGRAGLDGKLTLPNVSAGTVERSVSRITLRKVPEEKVQVEITVTHPISCPGRYSSRPP